MAVTVDGTVVEEEKVDLEIPQEKVDVKNVDSEEPESAGGCDVCLPPNGLIGCGAYDYHAGRDRVRDDAHMCQRQRPLLQPLQ